MRAYFNILINGQVVPDSVGQEIADEGGLRTAASTVVRALVQRHGSEAQLLDAVLLVTDGTGRVALEVSFFEALYQPVSPVADPHRRKPVEPAEKAPALFGAALKPMRKFADAVTARVQAIGQA